MAGGMALEPVPTVPYVLAGDVAGLDGGRLWPVLPEPMDRLTLWVVGGDLVSVDLDLAGVRALLRMLEQAESAMQQAAEIANNPEAARRPK